jgi:phosphoglycolate phosphatase
MPAQIKITLPLAAAYVFDIDGTLLVTQDLVHWNALHQAMREAYGIDTTIEGIPYHGKTDLSILRAALAREGIDGQTFEASLPRAREIVCREVEANHRQLVPIVCPGIPQILGHLESMGKLIGVASGNLETVGWRKIQAAGLGNVFSFGCFSDRCESRVEVFRQALAHIARTLGLEARTCFVGDTPSDIRAAHQVGARILAVASGTFSLDELTACSPDACVSHCAELFATG